MSYSIYTGEGVKVAAGVPLRDARRIANAYGEPVEICDAATGETIEIVG